MKSSEDADEYLGEGDKDPDFDPYKDDPSNEDINKT